MIWAPMTRFGYDHGGFLEIASAFWLPLRGFMGGFIWRPSFKALGNLGLSVSDPRVNRRLRANGATALFHDAMQSLSL